MCQYLQPATSAVPGIHVHSDLFIRWIRNLSTVVSDQSGRRSTGFDINWPAVVRSGRPVFRRQFVHEFHCEDLATRTV